MQDRDWMRAMASLSGPQLASVVLVVLLAVAAGLFYQRATLTLTETEIIESYAAHYLEANPQGQLTHCRARAGLGGGVRMIVICGPEPFEASQHYEYHVGPLGGLIMQHGPRDWAARAPVAGREKI